ncbi:TerB family tellurite resistance protein [Aestuariibacter salexigens]|uniref:tellurite resistance TerB family protein n=1 Tax=Aestuariibacter salexigens TaxID=226010 RepID=UPI0004163D89|nr:TerB family tellurite resistance protein [Aestuariibacter salexigens]
MQLSDQQRFNEALFKLAILLYQSDGKITLTEQDYLDNLFEQRGWDSYISQDAFITNAIHEARVAVENREQRDFIKELAKDLNLFPEEAFAVAMEMTAIDGERSEEEIELLKFLSNKVLTSQVAQSA